MLKVLYLTSEYSLKSGWGTCSVNLINGLKDEVFESDICTYRQAKNISSPWPLHPILSSANLGFWKGLLTRTDAYHIRHRLSGKYDIIHTLVEPLALLGDFLASHFNAKHLIQLVGTYSVLPAKTRWREKYARAYKRAKKLVSISEYTARRVKEEFPGVDIDVSPLGVSSKLFRPSSSNKKQDYFLMVGQIKPRKGVLTALRAFKIFLEKNPGFEFRFVGDTLSNDYMEIIRQYVKAHNLPVRFLGQVPHEELVIQFQSCTAHVLPSESTPFNFEGFGLVHLEANMCGALSIGSLNSANEEVIDEGTSGFLVQQGNQNDVAKAMEYALNRVLENPLHSIQKCVRHAEKYQWNSSIDVLKLL